MGVLEKVTCPGQIMPTNCHCSDVVTKITNGDSFRLVYRFNSLNEPGALVNLNSFGLTAEYWIEGSESNVLAFEKPMASNNQCIVEPESAIIKFIFNGYSLNSGRLLVKFKFRLPDPQMPDGFATEYVEGFTGIIIN